MSRRAKWILGGALGLVAGVAVLVSLALHFARLPETVDDLETIVLGQSRYVPGSQAALRVVVRQVGGGEPIPGAAVSVSMAPADGGQPVPLFQGTTDASGAADVSFAVPAGLDPGQTLIVETSSPQGEDRLEQAVTLDRDFRILLTTDKPIYQPGQVIHLRALALSAFDRVPASGSEIEFIIADGKGNKVFRETVESSVFGVASDDFQLASEVNTGDYKITARMGNTSSEKTVRVEHYVLPKFDVSWQTDRSFYLPGERVQGSIRAAYFYGKAIEGGDVKITGFTFDFQRQDVFTFEGTTDSDGDFAFDFALPDYVVGTDLDGGAGRFYLEAAVTDLAAHTESSSFSLPVSQSRMIIQAIPESGQLRPGVENILYILTSYPDGTPAQTALTLDIDGTLKRIQTGGFGLAEYRFTPDSPYLYIQISARDQLGATASSEFSFEGQWNEETVLLRPDRAAYKVGDTMNLEVLTNVPAGQVYLDIVREGQTVSTRSIEVDGGRALAAVDLTPDLFGTLELHAYKILSSGNITRDTRLVVVDPPDDLTLGIVADRDSYLPGDTANLDFTVTDPDGHGAQSAIGIAVVDESVFALAQEDPGFAKLYFLLEADLLTPKYDIHGFSVPDLLRQTPDDPVLVSAIDGAAQASMADAATHATAFSLNLNSHADKIQRARNLQHAFFNTLAKGLFGLELLLPLAVAGLMAASVSRRKTLGGALVITLALALGLTLILFLIPVPDWVGTRAMDRLGYLVENALHANDMILIVLPWLGGLGSLGFIALVIPAMHNRDWRLGVALLLTLGFILALVGLVAAALVGGFSPGEATINWGVLAFLLVPLAYLFRSAGFAAERRFGWSLAAFTAAPAVIVVILVLVAAVLFSMAMRGDVLRDAGMLGGGMVVEEALPIMAPNATQAPADIDKQAAGGGAQAGEPPRLRQFFPETMLWLPEEITDQDGHLSLDVPMADSITTWRLTALASTQDGRLGSTTTGIRVFQDFFIDLDLPLALTQNDEISVPVGVFNYLEEPQTVRLSLEQDDWFELLGEPEITLNIAGNDIQVAYFRIKATGFGREALQVTASGSKLSDAVRKEVTVYPDGSQQTYSFSDRLPADGVSQSVNIPAATIAGTQTLTVKIYPGVMSQVVEGLESILRMPYGCFEQTSSTTYPNVLALDYLQTTSQTAPEVEMQAEEYINLGYQRLTTFEVDGGGFSLFGGAPADRMLTAYGLQEFTDMSNVHPVDEDIVRRAADWLLNQQASDGSWENDQGLVHESTWSNLENDRVPVTSYIVWSLIDAGYYDDSRLQSGLDYIKEHRSQADDPYVLALVANALVAADLQGGEIQSFTQDVLDDLAAMAQYDGDAAFWSSKVATFTGAEGDTGSIETTGLAAFALLRSGEHPEVANAALTYLIRNKDSFGTWHSTQATVLSLKSLLESVKAGAEDMDATVTIRLNGGQTRTVRVNRENFDVVQLLSFHDIRLGAANDVEIEVEGKGELMYQIAGSYYLPWDDVIAGQGPESEEPLTIDVHYDRTELEVDDTVEVQVDVKLNQPGRAEWALIDLGIPPGFSVNTEDLAALVTRYEDVPEDYDLPTIERFEMTGRQVLVYIGGLSFEHPLNFSYRMQAKFPLIAKAPASTVYDYYNPGKSAFEAPVELTVEG
jgi:uncharacterized protein YfaS (alpha-2-macroglobulin family)